MNRHLRHYLFAIIFLILGGYYVMKGIAVEASLYILAAVAFIFNNLSLEPRLAAYKRVLAVTTWILIGITAILFLYLLQSKYL